MGDDVGHELAHRGCDQGHGVGDAAVRLRQPGQAGQMTKHFPNGQILMPEQIAPSRPAALHRPDHPQRNVAHVDEVQLRVQVFPAAAAAEVEHHLRRR